MATKTITTNSNNGYTATLKLTTGTQSIAGNYTPISYEVTLNSTYSTFYGYTVGYEVKIDGKQVAYRTNSGDKLANGELGHNDSIKICSGSVNISHNTDGTKKGMAIYVRVFTDATSYTPGTLSKSDTMDLTTIARKSTPTFSPSTVQTGGTLTVNTNRASSSFTHTIKLTLGDATVTKTGVGASTSITVPESWASKITTAETATATLSCATIYNGSTIGTVEKSVTIKVDTSIVPVINSITTEPHHINDALTGWEGYLQNYTKCRVTSWDIADNLQGATIKTYQVNYDDITDDTTPYETEVFKTSGSQNIKVRVQDSRGRWSTYYTHNIEVDAYSSPYLSGVKVYRSNANMDEDDEGTYMTVLANSLGTVIEGKNNLVIKARYKLKNGNYGDNWTTIPSGEKTILASISPSSSYDVELQVQDTLGEIYSVSGYVPTEKVAIRVVHLDDGNISIGLGKAPEGKGFESDLEAMFYKDVEIAGKLIGGSTELDVTEVELEELQASTGVASNRIVNFIKELAYKVGLIVDHPIEEGISGIWFYEKWASGKAVCYGYETKSVPCTSVSGNVYFGSTTVNLPSGLFTGIENIQLTAAGSTGAGYAWFGRYATVTNTSFNALFFATVSATKDIAFSVEVIGRWK